MIAMHIYSDFSHGVCGKNKSCRTLFSRLHDRNCSTLQLLPVIGDVNTYTLRYRYVLPDFISTLV